MNSTLLELLYKLKEAIENDPRVLLLKKLDAQINRNEDVMKLAYKKDIALTFYEDCLKHCNEDSKEVKDAQRRLHNAKLSLDNNQIVKQYNDAYREVRLLYERINDELFSKFIKKSGCSK